MKDPKFTPEDVMSISSAGAGLLKWVVAMVNYNAVAKEINPKRKAVAQAEASLRTAEKDLARVKAEVSQSKYYKETSTRNLGANKHYKQTRTGELGDCGTKSKSKTRRMFP
jgi:dynein heavy chain